MELGEYISKNLEEKAITKELLQKHLGFTRGTLYNKLKNSNFSVQEFEQMCKFLNINPSEWFSVQGFEHSEIDKNHLNEPENRYLKIKNSANEKLNKSSNLDSLIEQNMKLIEIIDRLTRELTDRQKTYK